LIVANVMAIAPQSHRLTNGLVALAEARWSFHGREHDISGVHLILPSAIARHAMAGRPPSG